ncbi:MAG: glycosyltransferase family 4 protein [Gammaproteobacteria bacterium]|nr:glycosyltransferase family 4 protein [Gammaproteobacteria bacterium]
MSSKPCAIFVANRGFALTSSRLPLIRHLLGLDWKVVAVTAVDVHSQRLIEEGVILEPLVFNRGGFSPGLDWYAFSSLRRIYHYYQPRLIHHFHAKPVILGSIAAHVSNEVQASVVNTITGLGYAFTKGGVVRWLAGLGYRLALPWSDATIFQNPDDRDLFLQEGWVSKPRARLVISSGVDCAFFCPPKGSLKNELPKVLMVGRVLRQKGVQEFIDAARIVKRDYPKVRFQLAGECEPAHPDSVPEEIINRAVEEGIIEYLGYTTNLHEIFPLTYVFVFPSFYREGVPRVVLEAAACGVPTISADVPGSREAVIDGETGYLVPPKDSQALAERIEKLLRDKELRKNMGEEARDMAVSRFDINVITHQQLDIYRDIGIRIN